MYPLPGESPPARRPRPAPQGGPGQLPHPAGARQRPAAPPPAARQIRLADKIAYWATFVIVVVMPVDVLCPPKVMQLFYGWQLNLWLLLALWLRMCWTAFIRIPEPMKRVEAA